jgi:hypothetical protein
LAQAGIFPDFGIRSLDMDQRLVYDQSCRDYVTLCMMMKTLNDTLELNDTDELLVTKSGRIFQPYHKDLLDNIPSDIVREMARRRIEEIKKDKNSLDTENV